MDGKHPEQHCKLIISKQKTNKGSERKGRGGAMFYIKFNYFLFLLFLLLIMLENL